MKIRFLLALVFVLAGLGATQAQVALKIGHVDVEQLVETHPALDSIHAVLEQETRDMEEVYAEMLAEQQTKMETFEKESAGYSAVIRQARQEELLALSQKIQNYNQTAQQQLRQRNMQLIQPVYLQVTNAINEVATEKALTYVLDVSTGSVAFVSPTALDITELVKERLKK